MKVTRVRRRSEPGEDEKRKKDQQKEDLRGPAERWHLRLGHTYPSRRALRSRAAEETPPTRLAQDEAIRSSSGTYDSPRRRAQTVTVITLSGFEGGNCKEVTKWCQETRCATQRWLINEAMQAAPNPLSIFTTDTLGAQVLSIPRSAATPPKEAPYPTLVGTAMTGPWTRD